jgi:predicted amino acid dehydrogenase
MVNKIQKAVDFAAKQGASIISLGAYTSIVTRNGTQIVAPEKTRIITGNSLTAGVGIRRMLFEMDQFATNNEPGNVALVGATGNIGTLIGRALIKSNKYSNLHLLTRRPVNRALLIERYTINTEDPKIWDRVLLSSDMESLFKCNYIIAVSNSAKPVIFPSHINTKKNVFIVDVSIPSAVSSEVKSMPNVTIIPFTAYLGLPHDPDYVISTCIPRGTVFCCMAEAILCGLNRIDNKLTGAIELDAVDNLLDQVDKQGLIDGFKQVKSFKTNTYDSAV